MLRLFDCALIVVITSALANESMVAAELKLDRDNILTATDVNVTPGSYQAVDADDNGVLHVCGDKLVIDFQGATLDGAEKGAKPDDFRGRGIVVEDSSDVVVKNARIRGFKLAVYAKNCRNLTIEGCDLSDNWKQHLLSSPRAENGADWLFGHENDNNEWLRYGAAIYLDGCSSFTLRNNIARRGQNGICLVRSHDGAAYDNDCSFNSGWGLAMYRASRNRIAHNKFDWCIRGYSHGIYNRGQDSAGILVFEQCSNNLFAYNSATHGGDGFFLFAGLETIDETGGGGCNDNLVFRNDFSHASNNGIEATFSTGNRFVENIMDEADHAIWAGYSYGSQFVGNKVRHCNHGVSIEHGSDNRIVGNQFDDNGTALNLWANDRPGFADKPFGKSHPCRSEDYAVVRNRFRNNRLDVRLVNTSQVGLKQNDFQGAPIAIEIAGRSRGVAIEQNNISGEARTGGDAAATFAGNYFAGKPAAGATSVAKPLSIDFSLRDENLDVPEIPGRQNAYLPPDALRGLKYIFVDDWGPYDFSRVKVVPDQAVFWNSGELRILGPPTLYRINGLRGDIDASPLSGTLPAVVKIAANDHRLHAFSFTVDLPEKKQTLPISGLLLLAEWNVTFYRWKPVGPQKPPANWSEVITGPVLDERKVPRIDFAWGIDAPGEKVPANHFATVATAEIELPAGQYELRTVSDDGIRVMLDGKTVIDNWTWHPPTQDKAAVDLSAGTHAFRLEHFEIDGVAQMQFWLTPARK